MRRSRWLGLLGACPTVLGGSLPGQDPALSQRAIVTVEASQPAPFVEETVSLTFRIEIDREWFARNGVPLFRQSVGVPAQLLAPWLDGLEGASWLPVAESAGLRAEQSTMAINAAVAAVSRQPDVQRDGRDYRVYQCVRRLRVSDAGELVLAAPRLKFAYATEFVDDIVQGRTALDRHLAEVKGNDVVLRVRALPESGRPSGFGGAVGRFKVQASVRPTELAVGEQLQLELTVEGDGNFGAFDLPRLDDLPGLHLLGAMDRSEARRLVVTYDLQPMTTAVREVPAIVLPFFDPTPPGAYRVARTSAVGLTVSPGVGGAMGVESPEPAPPVSGAELADIATMDSMPADHVRRLPPVAVVAALLLPWLLAGAIWSWRRSQWRTPELTGSEAGRVETFAALLEPHRDDGVPEAADLERAFAAFLSVRAGEELGAASGETLQRCLVDAGISEGLAMRAARQREKLAQARYAGLSPAASAAALALVEELAAAFDLIGAAS